MSVYPEIIYKHARRLAAERSGPLREETDLLLAIMQAQGHSRRLLQSRDVGQPPVFVADPAREQIRPRRGSIPLVSSNAA